jgi:hypothetical protein
VELAFDIAIIAVLLVGLVLVVRDTARRSGRWGINFRPLVCPRCGGAPALPVRVPRSADQALWGGRTCKACGCAIDKWGREVSLRADRIK